MNVDELERIAVRHDDGLALVSLDRPECGNAVDDRMHSELTEVFRALRRDPAVQAVVLTGAGDAFCVGGDRSPERRFETFTGLTPIEEALEIVDTLLDLDRPVVAAVNGDALGLGAILASMADAAVAVRTARIGDQHVRGGVTAGNGSTAIWPLLIGVNRAKRLLLGGELLSAAEAADIGLVSEVVDADALGRATALAREWAGLPAYAMRTTKRVLNAHLKLAVQQVMPFALALEEQSLGLRQRES
jgi:enoyl-CoA hydratase/carnithine racemase